MYFPYEKEQQFSRCFPAVNPMQEIIAQISVRKNEAKDVDQKLAVARLHNNAYTAEEVEDYLSQFIISMNNSSLVKVAIDIFLHEVIVDYDPESKTKKITVICNAHDGNGEDATFSYVIGSSNVLIGGPGGSSAEPLVHRI